MNAMGSIWRDSAMTPVIMCAAMKSFTRSRMERDTVRLRFASLNYAETQKSAST